LRNKNVMRIAIIVAILTSLVLSVVMAAGSDKISISMQIGEKTAYVNGVPVSLDVPPRIINGRTMVPIRFVSENFGAEVGWDSDTKTVTITMENKELIDLSKVSLPSSRKTITTDEFEEEILKIFNGYIGCPKERIAPKKSDVENLIEFAKPYLDFNEARSLIFYTIILNTPWKNCTVGLYLYGDYHVAFYTTEGWYEVSDTLKLEKILVFDHKPTLHIPYNVTPQCW